MTTFKNVCLVDSYHDIILDPVITARKCVEKTLRKVSGAESVGGLLISKSTLAITCICNQIFLFHDSEIIDLVIIDPWSGPMINFVNPMNLTMTSRHKPQIFCWSNLI